MKNPFLVGERIYLRPLEKGDAPLLETYINDSEVWANLMVFTPKNLQTEESWIDGLYKDDRNIVLGIALRKSEKLIGSTGLHGIDWKSRNAEFGILIGDKEEWNQGYGTEATQLIAEYAFTELGLNRLRLRVYEYNRRAIRCYQKAGFREEGILRQERYHGGRFWDVHIMGLLRAEWDAKRPKKEK